MKRLGVLGTLVWDRIWTAGDRERGAPLESWGGIAYSLAAAAAACPAGWEIVPIIKVGADLADAARDFLDSLPPIRANGAVRVVPEPNNRVEIRYLDAVRRGERLTGGVPPWQWSELAPNLSDLSALYVNFIGGFELELETAEQVYAHFSGPVYTDLHSLFLTDPSIAPRRLRPLPDLDRWIACSDAVQLNQDELGMAAAGAPSAARGAHSLLSSGAGLVAVTLGADGAAVAVRAGFPDDPARWPQWRNHPDAPPKDAVEHLFPLPGLVPGDPTGCGDVWGATLFAGLLSGMTIADAVGNSHRSATRKMGFRGASGLYGHLRAAS